MMAEAVEMKMATGADSDGQESIKCDQYTFSIPSRQEQTDATQRISSYKGVDPSPTRIIEWQNAVKEVRTGEHRKQIERARQVLANEGREKYTQFKKSLPGVTFGGVFTRRENTGIVYPTGFIVPDIDHVDVVRVREILSRDPNIWFAFASPGDGIKCGLRAKNIANNTDHKNFYLAVERYFQENYDITIDPVCKDISRLTFLSFDPCAFINETPSYFNIAAWEKEPPKIEVPEPILSENGPGKEKYALKVLESACSKIRESTLGSMHRTRLSMARLVGGYLHYIDEAEALKALESAVVASGTVNPEHSMKTVRDGVEYGKRSPIEIPDKAPPSALRQEISALSKLDVLDRELERNRIAEKYDVRKSVIDQFLKGLEKEKDAGTTEIVTPAVAWDSPVDGGQLVESINNLIKKHIILQDDTSEAIATWVLLTYCYDAFRILPLLGVVSPEKRCGKTTLLEVLHGLCNKAILASNISPPAVFRTIEKHQPTLLIDEADTFLKDNEELRGVLNSGHTRAAAFVIRVQGDDHDPVKFSTWAPKVVAMIGELPGTLQDRSVMVKLRRKAPGEKVAKLDLNYEKKCSEIRQKCQRWADDNISILRTVAPKIPETGNDRATDNWLPLFCIAQVCGGQWPELLKNSMIGGTDTDDGTITIQLLSDIRDILKKDPNDGIFSETIIEALKQIEDHPWADWNRGKGLTQNGLARLLNPFGIRTKDIRLGRVKKGYEKKMFTDAFTRYLSPEPPLQSATPQQTYKINSLGPKQTATNKCHVADEKTPKRLQTKFCSGVADENRVSGEERKKVKWDCGAI